MEIAISLLDELFFVTFPRTLYVNRVRFDLKEASPSCLKFSGPVQDSIVVVSFSAHEDKAALLPRNILVCGRCYAKRCENFYTPADATPHEVEQFFDYIAGEYEQTIDLRLNRLVVRRMLAAAQEFATRHRRQDVRVLDFGCGTGLAWEEVQARRRRNGTCPPPLLYGCDLASKMIQQSKLKGFEDVYKCSYAKTDFPTQFFDVIFCSFVAHYFADARPFDEMKRILRPGGLIIFNLPRQSYDQKPYYESVLQNGSPETVVSVTHWTVETCKVRVLPVIRYKPVHQSNRMEIRRLQKPTRLARSVPPEPLIMPGDGKQIPIIWPVEGSAKPAAYDSPASLA
jgi:ubiquinone/menaquinone biosynthesis C-methylase UbiE